MLIKYTGPKPSKRMEFNNATYYFTPTCEVKNPEHLRALLHTDMKGLFEVVKEAPAAPTGNVSESDTKPETTKKRSKYYKDK